MVKIKIGVIGVGYLGRIHAAKYAAMDDVDLVGVADSSREAAEEVAGKCHTTPYNDYRELLDRVDAVSVVVPTSLHYQVAADCFARGVDVMLEKPMTRNLDESDALIRTSEAKGLILQVGHLERFNPAVVAMQDYLTCPLFIESRRVHRFNPRGSDVDVVLDLMIHDIDIILNITPQPLKDIRTIGTSVVTGYTDVANTQLIFADGCTASVNVSRVDLNNIRSLRIFQPDSTISVNYADKEVTIIKRKNALSEDGRPIEEYADLCFSEQDALADELSHFVDCVRLRQVPLVSGLEGRRALQVALQIIDQLEAHRRSHQDLLCQN
ncbi:MAG: Gfo/Idh/MocA family oxidoreductase [Thermodesulfobacteriota bacterium]